jgi:hypothetical protein
VYGVGSDHEEVVSIGEEISGDELCQEMLREVENKAECQENVT